jgi:TolB-like protein/tetratricopeptide (TPR) repeat protein
VKDRQMQQQLNGHPFLRGPAIRGGTRYRFEDFILDADRRELTRGTKSIAMGPQVFDLLLHLVDNRSHVVSKDDLLDAVWNGRIVSESTLTSHINAARKAIGDSGEEQRLLRTISRKGYRFVGTVTEGEQAPIAGPESPSAIARSASADRALPIPERPSIAVLPFLSLGEDPEQDYFTDGVVDDIISALSRMRWLFVIARNSSFTYKGRAVDVKEVGRALGVRYVLEGSVRKAEHRLRITGRLIDATTGTQIWSERFESTLDDVFALQDQMTTCVVGALAPHLESAEIERARRKPTESLDAYDYYLRGTWKFRQASRGAVDEALQLFNEAIRRDPEFASAHAMAAWCHSWRKVNRWMTDPEAEIAEGTRLARRAVELGQNDAVALARSGHALAHLARDLDGGLALLDQALVLDPNLAAGWYLSGFLKIWRSEAEAAIEAISHGMRLSPLGADVYRMETGMALAHLLAGRSAEALSWAEKSSRHMADHPLPLCILVASYAGAGRHKEARLAMQQLLRIDPTLRVANIHEWLPFRSAGDLKTFTTALRDAGLPA